MVLVAWCDKDRSKTSVLRGRCRYTITEEIKNLPQDLAHDEEVFQEWKKKQIWRQE